VRRTAAAWLRSPACAPAGASRSACTVRGYRCQATVAGRGVAVGCAAAGRSISFLARHR
jgi:hypothetical protein